MTTLVVIVSKCVRYTFCHTFNERYTNLLPELRVVDKISYCLNPLWSSCIFQCLTFLRCEVVDYLLELSLSCHTVSNCVSLKCESEVEQIAIQLDHIYGRVVELNPVRSLCHKLTDISDEILIRTALAGDIIQTLIIVDPECNIPGLIVLPTVIGNVENVGLISDCHCVFSEC